MLASARCYPGTVMVEGTTLSEGRGTTRPFELVGAPDIDASALIARMHELAPQWLRGCALRACWFEPTFQKHVGKLCAGVQIHVEDGDYSHAAFRPWRLQALMFKALRKLEPKYPLWRDFPYEYERDRLAIDLLNGSDLLRRWVDDRRSTPEGSRRARARRREGVAPRAAAVPALLKVAGFAADHAAFVSGFTGGSSNLLISSKYVVVGRLARNSSTSATNAALKPIRPTVCHQRRVRGIPRCSAMTS